jgi:hypothetical protein
LRTADYQVCTAASEAVLVPFDCSAGVTLT